MFSSVQSVKIHQEMWELVHRRPGQGISHFGERSSPEAPTEAQNGIYAGVQFVCGLDHTRGPCACLFVQRAGHA